MPIKSSKVDFKTAEKSHKTIRQLQSINMATDKTRIKSAVIIKKHQTVAFVINFATIVKGFHVIKT